MPVFAYLNCSIGMGEFRTVDGVAGAADKTAAAYSDSLSEGELTLLLVPAALAPNFFQTCFQFARADVQIVHRSCVGFHSIFQSYINGIEPELEGHIGQEALEGKARMWTAVASHGAASREVGIHTVAVIFVVRQLVQCRDHSAGIICCHNSEGAIGAPFQNRHLLYGCDGAVFLHSHLQFQRVLVTPSIVMEHLGAIVPHFYRPACLLGKQGRENFQWICLSLSAETAAAMCTDNPDISLRNLQQAGKLMAHVVNYLS